MRKAIGIAIAVLVFVFTVPTVQAKRLLPNLMKGKTAVVGTTGASVKFRNDRKAITVTFNNAHLTKTIEYVLTYQTNGVEQGAKGTITPGSIGALKQEIRELLFGTCSKNVCRYDTGITAAKLTVTITLPNGKKLVKNFILKV